MPLLINIKTIWEIMWKVLGTEVIFLDIANTAKNKMKEQAGEGEQADLFRKILDESETSFMINGTTEYNTLFIRVPDDIKPEEIQMMADISLNIVKEAQTPFVEIDGVEQRFLIIFTNDKEPELIGIRKTPGMSSGAIYKPIIQSLDGPGRMNPSFE